MPDAARYAMEGTGTARIPVLPRSLQFSLLDVDVLGLRFKVEGLGSRDSGLRCKATSSHFPIEVGRERRPGVERPHLLRAHSLPRRARM
jgi:hypothetical protein